MLAYFRNCVRDLYLRARAGLLGTMAQRQGRGLSRITSDAIGGAIEAPQFAILYQVYAFDILTSSVCGQAPVERQLC